MRFFSESEVEEFGNFLLSYHLISKREKSLEDFVKDALKLFIESRRGNQDNNGIAR